MKDSITQFIERAALGMILVGAVYVGAYCFIVKRSVAMSSTVDPSKVFWVVSADFPNRTTVALFRPVLALDRSYIRRRYWESWYVLNETNKVFETDLLKIEQKRQGQGQ